MEWTWKGLAEEQHGVVARWQLRQVGIERQWERHQRQQGRLELATPRVLRICGSPPTTLQAVMTGVLDAGPGANASHDTCAWLFGLGGFKPLPVHVTTHRDLWRVSGVIVHEPRRLLPRYLTEVSGIPCTSIVLTVFDLAATIHPKRLRRIVHRVVKLSPSSLALFHQALDDLGGRGRPGTRAMREVLADLPLGSVPAESGTELEFEEILRNAGEAPLRRQVDFGGHEFLGRLDYVDDELDLVFEVDSRTYHQILPDDRDNDIRRDRDLDAHGRRVVRIPDNLIWRDRAEVVRIVREARRERRAERANAGSGGGNG